MPVTFSFEIEAAPSESNQVGLLMERFGWERLDAKTYRYPHMAERLEREAEDWFNYVIPALMLFRSYVLSRRLQVKTFALDAQSSTGYRRDASFGSPPLQVEYLRLREPLSDNGEFELEHSSEEWNALVDWLRGVDFPAGL